MPQIGEIRKGWEIRKNDRHTHIYVACVECGKERWVKLCHNKPRNLRCIECIRKINLVSYINKGTGFTRTERAKIKEDVLQFYGNGHLACVICGENRIDCLSLDHIQNDGYLERKNSNRYGSRFYYKLKIAGFPSGYQTLCMNCQFIKAAAVRQHKKLAESVGQR